MQLVLALILALAQAFSVSVASIERHLPTCTASNGYTIWNDSGRITYQTDTTSIGGWSPKKRVVIERIWATDGVSEYVTQIGALHIGRDGRATGCFEELRPARYEAWVALFGDWYTPLSPVIGGPLN